MAFGFCMGQERPGQDKNVHVFPLAEATPHGCPGQAGLTGERGDVFPSTF